MDIDELFMSKLGNASVDPSPALKSTIMRKTGRREFFRFNPSRFNIYYAGLIVAGIVAAGLLIFSKSGAGEDRKAPEPGTEIQNTLAIMVPAGKAVASSESGSAALKSVMKTEPVKKISAVVKSDGQNGAATLLPETAEPAITPAGLDRSHQRNGFFSDGAAGNKSLKEMAPDSEPLFIPSALAGCQPFRVSFRNNASAYDKYLWDFGDGGSSDLKEPAWIFENPGEYIVNMNASGNGLNPAWFSVTINVYPAPKASFEISPAKVVIPDEEVTFLNYSTEGLEYRWDFGDGNTSCLIEPRHRYDKFGNYDITLAVRSENGCSDSVTVRDAFAGSAYFVEMPNAFIPNQHGPSGGFYSSKSDETAEIFHPVWSGVSHYRLQIFSKRGILLFESNDINIGWDGYFKGQLSNPGVYVWKIRGNFSNGQAFSKMGDLTLLKN